MSDREKQDAKLAEISKVLNQGQGLFCDDARWLLARLLATRSELDYALGRIELYRKVEEWMKQA